MPKTRSWVARMGCVFIALGACAATHAQSIVTSNYSNQTGQANNNVIYKVTATPQTALPPSLSLAPLLNINPLAPNPATYAGFNSLAWVPSTQSGATVDLIASQTESASEICRFFAPNFSGVSTVPGPPNATQIWSCGEDCAGPEGPISLAVDTHGTLYVLSLDYAPNCESSVVELWAFAPVPISPNNPAGFATTPTLIDSNIAGQGGASCAARDYSLNNIDAGNASLTSEYPYELSVMDLMIAPPGVALPVTANDVLVLFGDSANCATGVNPVCSGNSVALLADYSSSTLATLVSGASASYYGSGPNAPLTVANSGDVPGWGTVLDSATEMQYFYPE